MSTARDKVPNVWSNMQPVREPSEAQSSSGEARRSSTAYTARLFAQAPPRNDAPRTEQQDEKLDKNHEAQLEPEKRDPRCEDCEICCESRAPHRMVKCMHSRNPHKYCEVCVREHLRATIFERSSPYMRCMGDGCVAAYKASDYTRVLDAEALAMRDKLEAQALLKNLDGLVSCRACDFQAFVDEDVGVFDCQNPKCRKSVCIKCSSDPHYGISCKQVGKRKETEATQEAKSDPNKAIDHLRRKVENMVSDALIRRCRDCRRPFMKDFGCNEMTCVCGNRMCYECEAQHIRSNHWGRTGCKHFANTADTEEKEREAAEKKAIAQVLKENPKLGLTEKDLKIGKVSQKVRRDEKNKKALYNSYVRGELWQPGMGIEGEGNDLLNDVLRVQNRIAGLDIVGRRDHIPRRPMVDGNNGPGTRREPLREPPLRTGLLPEHLDQQIRDSGLVDLPLQEERLLHAMRQGAGRVAVLPNNRDHGLEMRPMPGHPNHGLRFGMPPPQDDWWDGPMAQNTRLQGHNGFPRPLIADRRPLVDRLGRLVGYQVIDEEGWIVGTQDPRGRWM